MAKQRTLHLKPNQLWPAGGRGSTLHCGGVTIQFQAGKHGRRVKVTSTRHKPKHKRRLA